MNIQCQALRNVPRIKLEIALEDMAKKIKTPEKLTALKQAFHRYFEANIPVKYWDLEMKVHFNGDESLMNEYNRLTSDIKSLYKNGISICFAGQYGIGKTLMTTNVLKRALEKGYSGLYLNLNDIVSSMKSKDSYAARKELITTDFLVVDEFDPRYMATESASDFYGRMLEDILRNRSQNKLPLILCTNSPNPTSAFGGAIQESVNSLFNYVDVIPVFGSDYREKEKRNSNG